LELKVSFEAEINGETYRKGVVLNTEHITEEMVRSSLLGEIGEPFKRLMLDALRTEKYKGAKA